MTDDLQRAEQAYLKAINDLNRFECRMALIQTGCAVIFLVAFAALLFLKVFT